MKVIFSIPEDAKKLTFFGEKTPQYLAYVEWFKLCEKEPRPNHLLYRVTRALDSNKQRMVSIIPVQDIQCSTHLFPQFGRTVTQSWTSDDVLDKCKNFFINCFQSRYSYYIIR